MPGRPDSCPDCGASCRAHTGSYCQECGTPLVEVRHIFYVEYVNDNCSIVRAASESAAKAMCADPGNRVKLVRKATTEDRKHFRSMGGTIR